MKTNFLLPSKVRPTGWILFAGGLLLALLSPEFLPEIPVLAIANSELFNSVGYFSIITNDISDELILCMLVVGGLFIGFSRRRNEDEYIGQIRYESLVWATYFNFGIMIVATLFIYGTVYFNVLLVNTFSLLLFFILRFHLKLAQLNKSIPDDE